MRTKPFGEKLLHHPQFNAYVTQAQPWALVGGSEAINWKHQRKITTLGAHIALPRKTP